MEDRILLIVQGPFHTDLRPVDPKMGNRGRSTLEVLEAINRLPTRPRFFVQYAMWRDEPEEIRAQAAALVDRVALIEKPAEPGSCHRNFQAHSVTAALADVEDRGFRYALKTRSDMILTAKFAERVLALADSGSEKLLVTNLFTRLEPFHLSDMIMASTPENIGAYYKVTPVHYEDLFSPEVQFCRVFVRSKGLKYAHRQRDYFQFLRDWVELADFNEMELQWFKIPEVNVKEWNRLCLIMEDRDCGPVLTRVLTPRLHRFLQKTRLPLNLVAAAILIYDIVYRNICFGTSLKYWLTYSVHKDGPEYMQPLPRASRLAPLEQTLLDRPRRAPLEKAELEKAQSGAGDGAQSAAFVDLIAEGKR